MPPIPVLAVVLTPAPIVIIPPVFPRVIPIIHHLIIPPIQVTMPIMTPSQSPHKHRGARKDDINAIGKHPNKIPGWLYAENVNTA